MKSFHKSRTVPMNWILFEAPHVKRQKEIRILHVVQFLA